MQFQLCNKQVLARIFALPQGYFRGQSIINVDNFWDIFWDKCREVWDSLGNNLGDIFWVYFGDTLRAFGHFRGQLLEQFRRQFTRQFWGNVLGSIFGTISGTLQQQCGQNVDSLHPLSRQT